MDHFLSGLHNSFTSSYYSPRVPGTSCDFAIGTNSYQVIPISTSGVISSRPQNMADYSGCPKPRTTYGNVSIPQYSSPQITHTQPLMVCSSMGVSVQGQPAQATIKKEEDVEVLDEKLFSNLEAISRIQARPNEQRVIGSPEKWDSKKGCNVCNKVLSRGDKLKNHMRIHTNNYPFHCDTCGQGFLRAEGLRIHTRMHTGERPFVCIICAKSYTRKDKLTRHAIIHTGERPFVCAQCGKSFTRKDKLQRHELIHMAEKPWTCLPCNAEFVRQEGFTAHMEKKHPERLPYTIINQKQQRYSTVFQAKLPEPSPAVSSTLANILNFNNKEASAVHPPVSSFSEQPPSVTNQM